MDITTVEHRERLILAITAINAWNRITVSSGMIFKAALRIERAR